MLHAFFFVKRQYLFSCLKCGLFLLLCGCAPAPTPMATSPEVIDKKAENTIDDNKLASQRLKKEYETLQKQRLCIST